MRLRQIYEDGRIVKGVNTTVDVGPDEIKKQAAKFGNSVDKDGRPPTLSKKVKGAKTNVLFNLGLAESKNFAEALGEIANTTHIYVDMDGVLADFFTEWGKLMGKDNWRDIGIEQIPAALEKIRQTENFWLDLPLTKNAKNLLNLIKDVKGEYSICSSPLPGDPNSEPHKLEWIKKHLNFFPPKEVIITHDKPKYAVQKDGTPNILIDDYGKNINAWEAAGGVGFKHKDHKFERTAKDIKQHMQEPVEENFADGKINEVLDKPAAYTWSTDQFGFPTATAKELGLNIKFDGRNEPMWEVSFHRKQKNGSIVMNRPTGQGKEFQVFATVKAAVLEFMDKYPNTEALSLEAAKDGGKDDQGRVNLYRRMMKQYANKLGWEYDEFDQGGSPALVTFEISSKPRTTENFADGKKKGKSRPGRVKKSGASCNGSVTALRKRAKNASGEKAKMYHWCANMKSGKKK